MIQFPIHLFLALPIKAGVRFTRHLFGIHTNHYMLSKPVGKLQLMTRARPPEIKHYIDIRVDRRDEADQVLMKILLAKGATFTDPEETKSEE